MSKTSFWAKTIVRPFIMVDGNANEIRKYVRSLNVSRCNGKYHEYKKVHFL